MKKILMTIVILLITITSFSQNLPGLNFSSAVESMEFEKLCKIEGKTTVFYVIPFDESTTIGI